MTTIPPEAFSPILEELARRPLPMNEYRTKAGGGQSQVFGLVNKRSLPVDYSRLCWQRPKLYHILMEFAKKYVDIPWTSVTVNQNYRCLPHKDKGNHGDSFLVAFGDFTGGRLMIHEGPLSGYHDIRHKPIKTDFSKVLHSVEDFKGTRCSLVFYTLKAVKMPLEPLPPPSVVIENGEYLFKRGDQIIRPKEGLPHPLRKKKVGSVIVKTSGDFSVSFN